VLGDEVLIGQMVLEKLDRSCGLPAPRPRGDPAHPVQPVTKIK